MPRVKPYSVSRFPRLLSATAILLSATAVGLLSATSTLIDGQSYRPPNVAASDPSPIPAVPTEVVATGSKRTINVSWKEVPGTNYIISVRPKNGTELLEWVEYTAASSPTALSDKSII